MLDLTFHPLLFVAELFAFFIFYYIVKNLYTSPFLELQERRKKLFEWKETPSSTEKTRLQIQEDQTRHVRKEKEKIDLWLKKEKMILMDKSDKELEKTKKEMMEWLSNMEQKRAQELSPENDDEAIEKLSLKISEHLLGSS